MCSTAIERLNQPPASGLRYSALNIAAGVRSISRTVDVSRQASDGSLSKTGLDSDELLGMLQRPGAIEDVQEIMKKMLADPTRNAKFNATMEKVKAAQNGEVSDDAFARLLSNSGELNDMMDNPDRLQEIVQAANGSAVFDEMRDLGVEVLQQMRISKLEAGELVEITGLTGSPQLNGVIGRLGTPTAQELELHSEDVEGEMKMQRRIVEVIDGLDRLAVLPQNLVFPRYKIGTAVILDAPFAGEDEDFKGRVCTVGELTSEEREMGFSDKGGRAVVDILPLIPGGPVTARRLMWPENLVPRPFATGDYIELTGLTADTSLNGAPGTVAVATADDAQLVGTSQVVITLDSDKTQLKVKSENLRLVCAAAPAMRGFR